MQEASNKVAEKFLSDLFLNLNNPIPADRVLLTIREIGEADGGAAAEVFDIYCGRPFPAPPRIETSRSVALYKIVSAGIQSDKRKGQPLC